MMGKCRNVGKIVKMLEKGKKWGQKRGKILGSCNNDENMQKWGKSGKMLETFQKWWKDAKMMKKLKNVKKGPNCWKDAKMVKRLGNND